MVFKFLINEFFNIFIIVRLLKTIKKVIEEAEDRYLSACENNVPLKELDKLEENYKKSLNLMDMLETKYPEKTIKKKS